jgi:hypothetical protein
MPKTAKEIVNSLIRKHKSYNRDNGYVKKKTTSVTNYMHHHTNNNNGLDGSYYLKH